MILGFDTYYFDNKAKTVCICFKDWKDSEPCEIFTEIIDEVSDYESGAFYKLELPCILNLLQKVKVEGINYIIVDGFVVLDDYGKLGLGGYLYKALNEKISVIGIAKTGFFNNKKNVRELFRGKSKKPLYISAIGLELDKAYELIKTMHGNNRIPTLFQILDTKTKEGVKNYE
ncbi:endonuclease V [Bacteroidota bacterium]